MSELGRPWWKSPWWWLLITLGVLFAANSIWSAVSYSRHIGVLNSFVE